MDARLSPEQQALRDAAAQMVDRMGLKAVGDLDDGERVAKLDAAVASTGWRELRAAGDGGAPLASGVEVALVAEELARGLADVAFLGPTLAADLRRRAGASPAEALETVLLDPSLASLATVADAAGGPARSCLAVDCRGAAGALALVGSGDALRLGRVGLQQAGTRLDLTRPTAAPDPATAVAELADAPDVLGGDERTAWLALGLALTCADLVGTMRGAVRLATDYAKDRRQYGVAIGSFQAVQHLLADAHVATEGSRSVARHAAWAVDALPPDEALGAAAAAKAYCARSARSVCETAIQVHGGIGNTWDCLAHLYLRRALYATDVLGGVGPSLGRVLAHHGIGG